MSSVPSSETPSGPAAEPGAGDALGGSTSLPAGLPGPDSLLPSHALADEDDQRSVTRLQLFMGTRLGVATLLLGGTLLIALEDKHGFDSFTPRFLVSLIATIYGVSLVFAVWLLGSLHRRGVALAQVGTDLVVTTGLVYVTGGPSSAFTFLYGVAVLMAAMVIGPISARITGAAAIVLYGSLAASLALGWLPPPPDQRPDAYLPASMDLAQSGLLNVLGLLLVTLLAGNLSARLLTTGGALRLAEASAATLARLNDDIVRSLASGLLSTDLHGHIRTINPTGLDMLGARADDVIGAPLSSVLDVDLGAPLGTARSSGPNTTRAEASGRRADGTRFPVGYSISTLVNIDGAAIGALVLFQDLSEITRLREVAARQERLAVLGRLSAGLAHEIRNPLGSISGSVQLVRESPHLTDEERHLLGIILDEVERLDDLVATMLQVGRPREPHCTSVDLRATIEAVAEVARRGPAAARGTRIECILPDAAVKTWADGDQVRQVLWNLVKNALQASPPGGVVRVGAASRPDGSAVLEVSDEGQGIDPSQRDKVYNMFYSERTHGAGIGLALVRQIIDAHGATIEIRSEQNQGATFVVTFPARAERGRGQARASEAPTALYRKPHLA